MKSPVAEQERMIAWPQRGVECTEGTCKAAVARAKQLGIRHVVVASTSGRTARYLLDSSLNVTVVGLHSGYDAPGKQNMGAEERKFLEENGAKVLFTTHVLANVERSITNGAPRGLYPGGIAAATLRMFGQGTKVCVECACMALDAGLIPAQEQILAIAGTGGSGGGADTALVILPAHAKDFFKTQVLEIVCKPRRPR